MDREATLDDDGVWGEDPRKASADEGAAMLRAFLERSLPKIRTLLQEIAS
jgi:creatinine amidohydrolase/Fe(II)-dependent formamide hydrolase-like protein